MQCFEHFQDKKKKKACPVMIKARYEVFANTSVLLQIISFYLRVFTSVKVSIKMTQSLVACGVFNLHKDNNSFFLFVRYL